MDHPVKTEPRPCVRLRNTLWRGGAADQSRSGDSWFVGYPLMPPDAEWPRHPDHAQMPFLAQVDLHALAALDVPLPEGLPRDGTLQVFYDLTCHDEEITRLPMVFHRARQSLAERRPEGQLAVQEAHDCIFAHD